MLDSGSMTTGCLRPVGLVGRVAGSPGRGLPDEMQDPHLYLNFRYTRNRGVFC